METYEVLEKALALIEDEENWGQGRAIRGNQRCAIGAIVIASNGTCGVTSPILPALTVLGENIGGWWAVLAFNDTHSHAEVVALFKTAIRREKAKEGIPLNVPEPVEGPA